MNREQIVKTFARALGSENERQIGDFVLTRMASGQITIALDGQFSDPIDQIGAVEIDFLWSRIPVEVQQQLTEPPIPTAWLK